jgi:hypothetical protein
MKCPSCQKEVPAGAPEMPFCSERCQLIDLGRWANEEYRIPVVNGPPEAVQAEESEPND